MTSVPVEWLFGVVAALVSAIYLDLRSGINRLENGANKRDILLARICEKLGLTKLE